MNTCTAGEHLHRSGLLLFVLLSLAIAALLRIDFYFTVLYLLIMVYVFSHWWVRSVSKALRLTRTFADHAFWGDHVTVRLQVSNTGWLPITWLALHESLPVQLAAPNGYRRVFGMGPHGRQQFEYTLFCNRRGLYEVGPLSLETGDVLGVAQPRHLQLAAQRFVVYPEIVPLPALGLPTYSPLVALPARSPLFEDPTRVMGVRDYYAGDSPRRMHWTATAAAGRLLVKRYQPSIARETLICLDLDRDGYGQRQRYTASELAIVIP